MRRCHDKAWGEHALFYSVALALTWLVATVPSAAAESNPTGTPACQQRTFDGNDYLTCWFDSRNQKLSIVLSGADGHPLRGFDRLSDSLGGNARRVRFAMNAGMFDAGGEPVGLYIERGRIEHPLNSGNGSGNFYLKPNGVFFEMSDGTLRILTSEAFRNGHVAPEWATQSGPQLVIDGTLNPNISPNGSSTNVRNGVGVFNDHVAYFVISETPVSFGRFARFFRDGLKCRNALYLDGLISSAWVPSLGRQDDRFPLGPMLVVLDRK
jgi:uncharacterized protein YigE (DUF2233 family)